MRRVPCLPAWSYSDSTRCLLHARTNDVAPWIPYSYGVPCPVVIQITGLICPDGLSEGLPAAVTSPRHSPVGVAGCSPRPGPFFFFFLVHASPSSSPYLPRLPPTASRAAHISFNDTPKQASSLTSRQDGHQTASCLFASLSTSYASIAASSRVYLDVQLLPSSSPRQHCPDQRVHFPARLSPFGPASAHPPDPTTRFP